MIYDILKKTLIGSKTLRIRFDEKDSFIKIYDGTRHLRLLDSKKYDAIYSSIRYHISLKSSITYPFCHRYLKIKVDSYDSLPIEKRFTLQYVIILT